MNIQLDDCFDGQMNRCCWFAAVIVVLQLINA
jgi:hypothetical protein